MPHTEKKRRRKNWLTRKESITPDHRRVRKYQPEKKKKLVSIPVPDANKNIKKGRRTGADGCAHQSYLYNIERRTTIKLDKTNNNNSNNSNNERKKKRKVTRREAYDQSDPVGCVHLRHLHILHRGEEEDRLSVGASTASFSPF
jgi:hypothetical protein